MLYPRSEDEGLWTEAALEGILEEVQLGYLCSRFGGLGANRDWQDELSLGEQQVSFLVAGDERGGERGDRFTSVCAFVYVCVWFLSPL